MPRRLPGCQTGMMHRVCSVVDILADSGSLEPIVDQSPSLSAGVFLAT